MIFFRSFLFNLFYAGWTLFLAVAGLPCLLMPQKTVWKLAHLWIGGLLAALRLLCGLSVEVRGAEAFSGQPVIVASKHQSALEILALTRALQTPCFVLKRSLTMIPLFGLYLLHLRMIAIDRARGASALKAMIARARARLAEGRPLVIFPEGTRARPGNAPVYHPGIAALYGKLHAPVAPVAINTGHYWGRNAFLRRPGTAVIEFLEPVAPGQYPSREFVEVLQARIEEGTKRLAPEAAER